MTHQLRQRKATRVAWDDLRYVLAVAESGSLAGAATLLRVNRTTVLRRINAFERTHTVRLFERLQTGYSLTQAGDQILAAARGLENTIETLERKLAGQDLRPEGSIRVTTTDTLMSSILPAMLNAFQRANSGITLHVTSSNTLANLSKRDADVAIRPVVNVPETLVGRRVCAVAFAIYSAANEAPAIEIADERWIAPDETLAKTSVGQWMRESSPAGKTMFSVDSLLAMREVCAAGGGLAALPCYLADTDSRLERRRAPLKEMTTALWVVTHPDLARTARVRLFMDFMTSALARERPLMEGQRPRM
ncbi:MAG TPA: LysR family transcriptional regulator [Steroidobacteraceae bacterium]|nr:LysR family transcriptional regulator [Steroidobacteraceae bacterium]